MAIETAIQSFLHNFEQGRAMVWIRRLVVATLAIVVAALWFFAKFNGFSNADAMDQAQIGRQLASGQGYTTLYARPLAMHLMLARTGNLGVPMPDISQAPLGPLLNAVTLRAAGMDFGFAPGGTIFAPERAIALSGLLFFAGALFLAYRLGRRLFDAPLALLGTGLLLILDLCWRFAFSGLPQMAMLFFFNGALLALVAALEARAGRHPVKALFLVSLAALLLGLVTLGHGIGLWIFAGFWVFAVIALRPRWLVALITPVLFALPLLPWVWHNWRAVRHPLGLPFFELLRPPGTDNLAFLADFEPVLKLRWDNVLHNTATQTIDQLSDLPGYFGGNFVAFAFFLAVALHIFRHWQAAQFRWAVLLMWLGAVAGMSVFGVQGAVSVSQLHFLFLPVMTFYGLAFLLVLWGRLGLEQPVLRSAFITLIYLLLAIPLGASLLTERPRVNWPPYLPPLVQRFSDWVQPDEAIAADIPWATAWYAGRRSLLLPANVDQFELIHGEGLLGAPLVGLYLTPFSSDLPTYADIVNGRYQGWARFVLREIDAQDIRQWILRSAVNLPINGQSIFFADRPRWR
jgi:hypothetical protein